MDFDARTVHRHGFDLDTNDLVALQLLENAIQNPGLGPAIHPRVDRVPIAKTLGQTSPLTTMLGHIQDRVEDIEVGQTDVASLPRKAMLNRRELLSGYLHARSFAHGDSDGNSVNTP